MKGRCLLILLCFIGFGSIGQGQPSYYEPSIKIGHYTPFSPKHKYIADYHQYGLQFNVGWNNYGLMVGYTHNTLDSVIYYTHEGNRYGPVGHCFSLVGYVNESFYKSRYWSFDFDILYGADLWTRHGNEMLGSALNFHVSFGIGPTIRLSEQIDLTLRYLYYHSSNGATFLPDNGINSHLVRMGLRYYPNRRQELTTDENEPFQKKNNWFVSEGIGFLQTYTRLEGQLPNETPYFLGNTLRFGFTRQFHRRFRWNAAMDFLWTGETRYCHDLEGAAYNGWNSTHLAASADFEVLFGRFAFSAGMAYYLYHGSKYLPEYYTPYFERVGYKMYFGKANRMFIGTLMKIHLNSIDYIEWTYGIEF
ncbi:MAG: acyloxyacyl hydrolase [Bacteroidales bacterium]|nr:acyloxyacyl hydrolase [Bacteroidales bacterium]